MKITILLSIIIITIVSCSHNKSKESNQKAIRIDTTQSTNPPYKKLLTISKNEGNIEIEKIEEFVDLEGNPGKRFFYKDSNGVEKYSHENKSYKIPEGTSNTIFNKWYVNSEGSFVEFELIYLNNKVQVFSCTIMKEFLSPKFWYFVISPTHKPKSIMIWDYEHNKKYLSEKKLFLEMDTEVSTKYQEWTPTTKLEFGKVHKHFVDEVYVAFHSIDKKYLDIAMNNHSFELDKMLDEINN